MKPTQRVGQSQGNLREMSQGLWMKQTPKFVVIVCKIRPQMWMAGLMIPKAFSTSERSKYVTEWKTGSSSHPSLTYGLEKQLPS